MHSKIKEWPVTSVKRSGGRLSWCQHCWKSTFISLSACAFLLGVRCEFLNLYIGTPKEKEVIFAAKKRPARAAAFFSPSSAMSNVRCMSLRKSARVSLLQNGHFKAGVQITVGI